MKSSTKIFTITTILVLIGVVVIVVNQWQWVQTNHEILRNVLLGMAALVGLPILIWRGFSADTTAKAVEQNSKTTLKQLEHNSKQLEITQEQLRNTQQQIQISENTQINERFVKAVEQLSNEVNATIRLGGIFSLFKIAKDSEAESEAVFKILHSRLEIISTSETYKIENKDQPSVECQEIFRVLCTPYFKNFRINISEGHFCGMDINNAILSNCKLYDCDFSHSIFLKCDFSNSELSGSRFSCADLSKSNFESCNLKSSNFRGAILDSTSFKKALLCYSNFENQRSIGTIYKDADLYKMKLRDAYFKQVKGLTYEQITQAYLHSSTKLPQELEFACPTNDEDYPIDPFETYQLNS